MPNTRIDLTKRITPVTTHDGRVLARFSDRATARRMAAAWGGCIVGATHTDPGYQASDRAPFVGYGDPAPIPARLVHPDPARAIETARFLLKMPRTALAYSTPWEWRVNGNAAVWVATGDNGGNLDVWYALTDSTTPQISPAYDSAVAALRSLHLA